MGLYALISIGCGSGPNSFINSCILLEDQLSLIVGVVYI